MPLQPVTQLATPFTATASLHESCMQAVWRGHSVRRRAELQGRREAAAALEAQRQAAVVRIQVSFHTKHLQYSVLLTCKTIWLLRIYLLRICECYLKLCAHWGSQLGAYSGGQLSLVWGA